MKVHIQSIYRLHGINALPQGAAEIELVARPTQPLTALLTADPERYFTEIDRSRAIANQLLKGIFAPEEAGKFGERLAAEIALVKEARAKKTTSGVFVVLQGEVDIPAVDFKARRDTDAFGLTLDAISKDEIREKFRLPMLAVITALTLSLPDGSDREFEMVGELIYSVDEGSSKPIYVLNLKMGTARISVASPLTTEIICNAAALVARLEAEPGSLRAYSLLQTSLDRATDGLQGFIAAWCALEMFINGVFKSTYEDCWRVAIANGPLEWTKPIIDRLKDVPTGKYPIADKFLIMASLLDAASAQADGTEFRRLKKVRDDLLHGLDVPPGPLPREAVQRLLVKFMKVHLASLRTDAMDRTSA